MTLRRWLALLGFALLAIPGMAQTNQPASSKPGCLDDLSARLEARLKALPDHWDKIPPPLVPVSGQSSEEVLAAASKEEQALVSEWITFLAHTPPAERAALIRRELEARTPSEVDIWLPQKLTGEPRTTNREEPMLYIEAWLEWVEALGRKDALFLAADLGLDELGESRSLLEIAARWVELPAVDADHAARTRSGLFANYAARLFRAGEDEKAIDAYRSTRKLYQEVGNRRGQINTFRSEADTLSRLGEHEKALAAYRSARKILEEIGDRRGQGNTLTDEAFELSLLGEKEKAFENFGNARKILEEIGDRRGQGNTFREEAGLLSRLGEKEKALAAYRRAHELFEPIGDRRGQGNTFLGEAEVLSGLGDNEKALAAYSTARKLLEEVGDRRGQGNTFRGEAEVLRLLGDNEKALAAYRSAHQLFEEEGDRRGQGNTFQGEAEVLSGLGDNQKALEAYKRARQLFEQVGGRLGKGNTFLGEAGVLSLLGDKENALDAYRIARGIYEQVGYLQGQGYTFLGEAEVLSQLSEDEKALDAYRSARKIYEQVEDRRGQAQTFRGEADILFRSGENEKALDVYRSARKLFEQMESSGGQGDTFRGEAEVLFRLGENEKALDAYRGARRLYERVGDRLGQGNTFHGEADILFQLGDNEQALDAQRSARKLYEQIGNRLGQGNTFRGEAEVLVRLGENEKALDAYRNARKIYQQIGDRVGQGNTFRGEADILFQSGENEKALDAYRSARKLYEEAGARLGQGITLAGEADVLLRLGDNERPLAAYSSARKLFQDLGALQDLGNIDLREATLQSRKGNGREAKNLAAQAVAAYHKTGSAGDERDAWLLTAKEELSSGNLEPAVTAARDAVRLHAAWRSKRISETQRAEEDESISAAYDILVPVLLSEARPEQALAAAEEARSHVLLDLVAAGFRHGKTGAAVDLRAERQRLEGELSQVETESRQTADASRLAELQTRRSQIDRELGWNQYQTLAAEQDALLTAQPLDALGIRAVARETGPVLLYHATDKELIGFLVPADGTDPLAARIDAPRGRLTEAVRRYLHDEANPFYAERSARQSHELWDLLLAPFAARLPAGGPLVIVPHGPLHELPFETLLDPAGTPLFARWTVSVAPSVSTLARARERHQEPRPKDSFLVFSSGRGLEQLETEAGEVAQLFGNDKAAFKPTAASFENYEHLVPAARQLLISTNGTWAPGNSRQTYLEILPTRDAHDSRLSVAGVAAIPLTAELVALEACDTARGETRPNDERLDLTRAFLIAGAASVLATRWKVPDTPATTRFLLDFYRAYRQGGADGKRLRKDQALTEARRRSRERGDPAQVWAAWVLVGDAR